MRICNKCSAAKPLTHYHRAAHCRAAHSYICKVCARALAKDYAKQNAETIKAAKAAYRQTEAGKETERRGWRKYRANAANRKAHNQRVGERVKARRRVEPAFRQKKMDLARNHYLKRYGSRVALAALFDSQLGRCANPYCGVSLKDGCHVDHIMPVALGGSFDLRNLQFLCPDCNFRKNKLHPDEWERLERERAA
jgi:5-methylcytosine-specific restriction endonuclease McrA